MITCPYCNTVNQSGAAFCSRCGTMLDNPPAEKNSATVRHRPRQRAPSGPAKSTTGEQTATDRGTNPAQPNHAVQKSR